MLDDIGIKIKNRRIELGMTQDELAQKVGFKNRSSINKIECEVKGQGIKMNKIENFAKALEVSVDYLMGWDDDPDIKAGMVAGSVALDKELLELVDKYNQLNSSNKVVLRTMLDTLLAQQSD